MNKIINLTLDSKEINYLCNKDKRLCKVIHLIGPLSYRLHDNSYEFLIHEIIEQMLSKKAGNKIFSRLVDLCNGTITPEKINLLTDEQIKNIGTSNSKVIYIRNLTTAVLSNQIDFSSFTTMSDNDVFNKLVSIKGIGKWTANMYLIFVLNRLDILPTNDAAFLQSFKWLYKTNDVSEESLKRICDKWKPYSSIACRYLYKALDNGLTKQEFHL